MEAPEFPLEGKMAPKVALRRPGAAPGRRRPGAKAVAKAKAGVAPMRRSVPAPGRRRPDRRRGDRGWKDGVVMPLADVALDEMTSGLHLVLLDASYFRNKCNVAGKVKSIEALGPDRYLFLQLTGTNNEDMLKVCTAKPGEPFKVHLCVRGCGEEESGDFMIHAQKGRVVQDLSLEEDWILNLESVKGPPGVDELALLREREKKPEAPPEKDKEKVDSSSSSSRSKKKKKKRKKSKKKEERKSKKRKKEDEAEAKSSKAKKEEEKRADGRSPMVDSTKGLESLFGGTGLDPRERVRRRVVRRARTYLKKRGKEKSSNSDSSSTSRSSSKEGEDQEEMSLFQETGKCRALYERYPGVLAQASLVAMREALMLEMGAEAEVKGPRASAMMYARQQLAKKATGPVLREVLNLCTALDHIKKGNPSRAADVICQRLKSLELILGGTHWSVAQRLECTSQDSPTISSHSELKSAQKETFEEVRLRQLASHAGPRADDKIKGGKGKNKEDKDNRKGKGKGDTKDGGKADKEKK